MAVIKNEAVIKGTLIGPASLTHIEKIRHQHGYAVQVKHTAGKGPSFYAAQSSKLLL